MRGWFDLFRENGGPTLYAHSNRTPVIGDVTTITLCTVFATLYLAFFIVFPGIRRERFTTFLSVSLSLFVGTAILIGNNGTSWHHAQAEIASSYKSFSDVKIMGKLGVYIGLSHTNVTLEAMPIYYNHTMDVNFNERFRWGRPNQLEEEYKTALIKGLPFPILTVIEYLAVDAEGFCWGRNYREAGYYTSIFLWAAFVLWVCMNMLLVIVPRYGAYLMTATGGMMMFSDFVYWWLLPGKPLVIHVEGVTLTFELGWCFWLTLVAGFACFMVGLSISIIDLIYPHKFSTILEMDYGTPFDRHTIIEDSHETKKKKKIHPKLEEPLTVGFGGLLRRLSKRDRDRGMERHPNLDGAFPQGHDNYAYEMEAPKSPWRYPHLMFRTDSRKNKSVSFKQREQRNRLEIPGGFDPSYLRRKDSKDSECSSIGSSIPQELRPVSVPHFQDQYKKFKRTDSSESSSSSLASFSAISAILGRNNSRKKAHRPHHQIHPTSSLALNQVTLDGHNFHDQLERADSNGQSSTASGPVIRGSTVQQLLEIHGVSVDVPADVPDVATVAQIDDGEVTVNNGSGEEEEVAVIVGGRKNSTTKAVRRNSAEHQRTEASMW